MTKIRLLLVVIMLSTHIATYARLHVIIDSKLKTVETLMNVMKTIDTSYYGEGPAMIQIDYIDELSCKYCVYESLGCSEFNITQTDSTFCMEIYSMLGYIWGTDCCREDQPPFDRDEADIKLNFTYDYSGLRGKISICKKDEYGNLPDISDMEYVRNNPVQCVGYIISLIDYYMGLGLTDDEIYDFLTTFENNLEKCGLDHEREQSFKQICALYKLALENSNRELNLDDLKSLGVLTQGLNKFYGNN